MKEFQDHVQDNTSGENGSEVTRETLAKHPSEIGGIEENDHFDSNSQESVPTAGEEREDLPKGDEAEEKADPREGEAGAEAVSGAGSTAEEKAEAAGSDISGSTAEQTPSDSSVGGNQGGASVPPRYYSSTYNPPYYVPDFSGAQASSAPQKKKISGGKIALIAVAVAVAMLMSAIGGCFFGMVGAGIFQGLSEDGFTNPITNQPITLNKSNGTVVIKEDDSQNAEAMSYAEVVELVAPTVVEINTISSAGSGAGSGVLVAQDDVFGYLITNYHVAGMAEESIAVRLYDKTVYSASYIAGDEAADLSILSIKKTNGETFNTATFGNSSAMKTGDTVVAIGNPLGTLGGTVTHGIISGKDVDLLVNGFAMTLLQTDAAVNPGNSGGGLFNMAGQLIGIVNAKVSAEGIEGLAFAIPGDYACIAVQEAVQNGYVTGRPTLGIGVTYTSSYNQTGIFVTASNNSQLEIGDLLESINGVAIDSEADYCAVIKDLKIGDTVTVTGYRLKQVGFMQMSWVKFEITTTVTEYHPGN